MEECEAPVCKNITLSRFPDTPYSRYSYNGGSLGERSKMVVLDECRYLGGLDALASEHEPSCGMGDTK